MREEREKKKRRKSGRWWRYFQQAVLSFQRLFFARRGEGRGDCSFLDLPSSYFFQYVLSFSNLSPRLLTPSSSYPFYVSYVKSSTFQLDVFNSFLFFFLLLSFSLLFALLFFLFSSPFSHNRLRKGTQRSGKRSATRRGISFFFLRDFLSRCLKEKRSHAPNNGVSMTNAVTNYYPCKPVWWNG